MTSRCASSRWKWRTLGDNPMSPHHMHVAFSNFTFDPGFDAPPPSSYFYRCGQYHTSHLYFPVLIPPVPNVGWVYLRVGVFLFPSNLPWWGSKPWAMTGKHLNCCATVILYSVLLCHCGYLYVQIFHQTHFPFMLLQEHGAVIGEVCNSSHCKL